MRELTRRSLVTGSAAISGSAVLGASRGNALSNRVLIVASAQDISNFDPHSAADDPTSMLSRHVYDALVRADGEPPKIVPQLAESWTTSDDGLHYEFKLHANAKFHDGSKVTAEAVRYSFDRLLSLNKGAAWMFAGVLDARNITVFNEQTLRITLSKAFSAFIQLLPWVWVVNPALVEPNKGSDNGQSYLRTNTAGSGPFRLRRAEAGSLYEFERLQNGWRQGGGNVASGIWKIVRETSVQRLAVTRGDVHVALNLSSNDMDSLKDRPGVTLVNDTGFRILTIKMNSRHGPLSDVNLRRAISYAVDYRAMLSVIKYGKLLDGPFPQGMLPASTYKPTMTDLGKAKEHLSLSKYPAGGVKLVMSVLSGYDQHRQWSLILLDALKHLNLELEIRPMIWPDMVASTQSPETFADFCPIYQTIYYDDPDAIAYQAYHSSLNGSFMNPVYADQTVDDLIARARAEGDPSTRGSLYDQLESKLVDDAACLFILDENRKYALRSEVSGYAYSPLKLNTIDLFPISLG